MKTTKKLLTVFVIIVLIMQFFRPKTNNGHLEDMTAFINDTQPPKAIKSILENTCYDCHSSYTRYPWYNTITPVNYWMQNHIKDGKKHLDFSKWDSYSIKRKDHKLDELIEMVEDKEMPLNSYTWTHKDANLTATQIKNVINWAKQVRVAYSLAPEPQ